MIAQQSTNIDNLAEELAELEITTIIDGEEQTRSNARKKDLLVKMGKVFEAQGYPSHSISSKIISTVEGRLHEHGYDVRITNGYYYHIMRENGWSDPRFDSTGGQKGTPKVPSNTSVNKECVEAVRGIKEICNLLADGFEHLKDRKGEPLELSSITTDEKLLLFMKELTKTAKIAANAANAKTQVPTNTHHLFKMCLQVEAGMINVARVFLQAKLAMLDKVHIFITAKQAQKFVKGSEPSQLELFAPKNRDEALFLYWYGLPCPECKSWRVQEQGAIRQNLQCVDCGAAFEGHTLTHCSGLGSCGKIFYAKELKHIIRNKKCPDCGKQIREVPSHLKEMVRHA